MSKSLGKEEKKKEKTAPSKQVVSWIRRTLDTGAPWLQGEFRRMANYTQAEMSTDAFAANTDKNRFAAVPCQDQRRVVLKWPGCPIDYIHANYVATPHGPKRFICTQGPLDCTIMEFWTMVVQEETNTIVMLCNVIEKLIVLPLAHVSAVTGDGDVEIPKGDCVDGRQKGDRLTAMSLLTSVSDSTKPIVVHCSAGIGRTGTLVAIELAMELLAAGQDCSAMDELLKMLRDQRAWAVQNDLQYLYIHRVLLAYFLEKQRGTYGYILKEGENKMKYAAFIAAYCGQAHIKKP